MYQQLLKLGFVIATLIGVHTLPPAVMPLLSAAPAMAVQPAPRPASQVFPKSA